MNLLEDLEALERNATQGRCRVDPCWSQLYLDIDRLNLTLSFPSYPAKYDPRPDLLLLSALRNSAPLLIAALRKGEEYLKASDEVRGYWEKVTAGTPGRVEGWETKRVAYHETRESFRASLRDLGVG